MNVHYTLANLNTLNIALGRPQIVFLHGDLGAGKTTLCQQLIAKNVRGNPQITSPTYVYYNKYEDIYHFDLYRLRDYDEFISIGGEEVLDNNEGIIFIEWPEKISQYYKADISIYIEKTDREGERIIRVEYS